MDLGGLAQALARAGRSTGFKAGLAAAAVELAGEMKRYPPVRRGPQPFKTRKQQRAFFAMLKSGEIDVPYRRGMSRNSKKLGQSWTTQASNQGFTQTVGTAVSYAKWVVGTSQSGYHKQTGWKRVDVVAREFERRAVSIISARIAREL